MKRFVFSKQREQLGLRWDGEGSGGGPGDVLYQKRDNLSDWSIKDSFQFSHSCFCLVKHGRIWSGKFFFCYLKEYLNTFFFIFIKISF